MSLRNKMARIRLVAMCGIFLFISFGILTVTAADDEDDKKLDEKNE